MEEAKQGMKREPAAFQIGALVQAVIHNKSKQKEKRK